MENPRLIEEISSLVKKEETKEELPTPNDSAAESAAEAEEIKKSGITYENRGPKSTHRTELLGAMKPYLSKERAKAIDSMLTIVDILDVMKGR